MDATPTIAVAVRIRPPNSWEAARLPEVPSFDDVSLRGEGNLCTPRKTTGTPLTHIVRVTDKRLLIFDPPDEDTARAFKERGFWPPGTKRYKDRRFLFDRVFDVGAHQRDVFEETAKPLLDGLFEGFNATVFAYGATGCGKTYTISGTEDDPGLIYLTMAELFQQIEDKKDEVRVDVTVTFLEIYNEEIRDLLVQPGSPTPKGGLVIREDKFVQVSHLTELRPSTAEEVKEIVLAGNARRTQSPTHANETSSRSHAVLQIHLATAPRTADTTELHKMATLSIIDLAGSERASATKNMGERMVEGANINKSLLALGSCINALCESGGRKIHVPYRNSKLTRLLKFSLGGNCKTVMIVCIAPASNHFDDTHNTLVYAERAKKIKTKTVTANFINVDRHVGQYVEAINRLHAEVAELKSKLASKSNAEAESIKRKRIEVKAEVNRAKIDMQTKLDESREIMADGAACAGTLYAADARLQSLRTRLALIGPSSPDSYIPSHLVAERNLLLPLIEAEEKILRDDSAVQTRIRRSNNTSNMFAAMLRAVCERRQNKLDEVSIENIALSAQLKKTEMEMTQARAETEALKTVTDRYSEQFVTFASILASTNALLKESSQALLCDSQEPGSITSVGLALKKLADANDVSLTSLVGHPAFSYTPSVDSSTILSFTGHLPSTVKAPVHRNSPRNSLSSQVTRKLKSPRKSVTRTSIVPSRRTHVLKEKKSLRWKDEVGQGSLDDASSSNVDADGSASNRISVGGSDSDWEDERADESVDRFISSMSTCVKLKKSRSSRLDPGFLKAGKDMSTLGSLAEDEETSQSSILSQRPALLTDRVNRPFDVSQSFSLDIPKGRSSVATPRMPSALRTSRRKSQIGPVRSEKTSRRRSSLLLQPLQPTSPIEKPLGGARRVPMESTRSPAKRSKRASLLGRTTMSMRHRAPVLDQNINVYSMSSKPSWK
ncbi:hypothetical protein Clacol_001650 [Clathrus columnatus]|uniref:Kinesin-like protein n=1 Tax=Clathrus columnatus TaxID=1419009 RepID=A0AAV5A2K5_9AGAM|nr:hypothetical protein Clacol_001650 [Clathrus columnatus]